MLYNCIILHDVSLVKHKSNDTYFMLPSFFLSMNSTFPLSEFWLFFGLLLHDFHILSASESNIASGVVRE